MAEQQTAAPKATKTKSTSKSVTLYNADGRQKSTSDPATIVALEFDGWSRDKSVFQKRK